MNFAAAMVYWIIIAIWAAVLSSTVYFYIRNPSVFGTTRLLLVVIGIDAFRNIFENVYFGLYFGAQYGVLPAQIGSVLGSPELLLLPKLLNIIAGGAVLGLLLHRWLPLAVADWKRSQQRAANLQTVAAFDPLTGLYNRRQFETTFRAELARCQRYMRPLSVLMIDVDFFKNVNDSFGHEVGDRALKAFATTIASVKRDSDIAARIGGEEFAILLPETGKEAAGAFAQRLCELVRGCPLDVAGRPLRLTVSIGVAQATIRTSGIETLMREADHALYEAKRAGRDRVAIASSAPQRVAQAAE
jgi:diguanylate cyclase (GGDEF)-like protein